jgi:hypothetical protein
VNVRIRRLVVTGVLVVLLLLVALSLLGRFA